MVEAFSWSPAFKQGIRERGKTNPTATYGELALRNLGRTWDSFFVTVGLLTVASGLVAHDIVNSGIIDKVSHGLVPQADANPQRYVIDYVANTILGDKPALALGLLSIPTGITTGVSAVSTVVRGVQTGISFGKDIKANRHVASR